VSAAVILAATGIATTTATPAHAAVGSTIQSAAQLLVDAHNAGNLTTVPASIYDLEIAPAANGTVSPGCAVDLRIFQILNLAIDHFGSVEVTDIQRPCIGSSLNCGYPIYSVHCVVPGAALDVDNLGGVGVNGSNTVTIQYLDLINSVAVGTSSNPIGANVGQSECRASSPWGHLNAFTDSCDHQHIDFRNISAPLNVPSANPGGTLTQVTASTVGGWQTAPTPITLQSGTISAVYMGGGWPQVWENDHGSLDETWGDTNGWHRQYTGIQIGSTSPIAAVNVPGDPNARVYVNWGGHVMEVSGAGGWHIQDTGVTIGSNAQIAAVYASGDFGQIWVNDGGHLQQVLVNGNAWIKGDTGVVVSPDAKISPVNVNGQIQVFVSSGGTLYQLTAGNGWQLASTGVAVGDGSISAVYIGGPTATIMVNNVSGHIGQVIAGNGWKLYDTGQVAGTGVVTAVNAKPGVIADNYPWVMIVR
jgi:hypothetical protein